MLGVVAGSGLPSGVFLCSPRSVVWMMMLFSLAHVCSVFCRLCRSSVFPLLFIMSWLVLLSWYLKGASFFLESPLLLCHSWVFSVESGLSILARMLSSLEILLSGMAGVFSRSCIQVGPSCPFISFLSMWENLHYHLAWNGHHFPLRQGVAGCMSVLVALCRYLRLWFLWFRGGPGWAPSPCRPLYR